MKEFSKKKLDYFIYVTILILIGFFFFFFMGEQGYVLEKDSGSFLNADEKIPYQYIVYPKFLEICQNIFSKENYLEWICNIQSILALIVSLITTEYLRKSYKFNYVCGILIFLCTFGPYAYTLPQYVSSHSIMTEGLAFPLFYLWMLLALEIYLHKRKIYFIPLLFVTVTMIYTRTQLLLFVVMYILMLIERVLQYLFSRLSQSRKRFWKNSSIIWLVLVLFVGVKLFLFMINNNILPQMTDAVAGRVFCAVEESDANLFEGKNSELFLEIFKETEILESRQCYFRQGIRQWEDIVNATNENTKMLVSVIRPFYEDSPDVMTNDVKGQLTYVLLQEHWDDYLYMTMVLMVQSFVVSIFVHPEFAYLHGFILGIFLYIFAIFFAFVSKRKYEIEQEYLMPLLLTFFVIFCICGFTNILFVGIQRYVVYPFGYFYISLLILAGGIFRKKKNKG